MSEMGHGPTVVLHVFCFEFGYSFRINFHFLLLVFQVEGTLPNGKAKKDTHTIYERESLIENTKTTQPTGIYQNISYFPCTWKYFTGKIKVVI